MTTLAELSTKVDDLVDLFIEVEDDLRNLWYDPPDNVNVNELRKIMDILRSIRGAWKRIKKHKQRVVYSVYGTGVD